MLGRTRPTGITPTSCSSDGFPSRRVSIRFLGLSTPPRRTFRRTCAWSWSATAPMPPSSRRSRLHWAAHLASSSRAIRPARRCKRMSRGRLSPSRVRDGERTCRTRSWRPSPRARPSSARISAESLSWSMRGRRGSSASPGMFSRWRMPSRAARAHSRIGPLTRCCSATAAPMSWITARARSS